MATAWLQRLLSAYRSLFLTNRFFLVGGGLVVAFAFGFVWPGVFLLAQVALGLFLALLLLDGLLLYGQSLPVQAERQLPPGLGLGDEGRVQLFVRNYSQLTLGLELLDEQPVQLQARHFSQRFKMIPGNRKVATYPIRPLERGIFQFGYIHAFVTTPIRLLQRRISFDAQQELAIFPSVAKMKEYELRAFDQSSRLYGIRRMRRIGHSYEFEQIKNYVRGDDIRSINWKATGRRADVMVNQYEDERSQQVYCLLEKSRNMQMPFDGLTLMDHAINATLAISNIVLKKHDQAGLITFSDRIGTVLKADGRSIQMRKLLQALYKEETKASEADFEKLYYTTRKLINGRALLLLFTNFESSHALERVLPILRRINQFHLLLVIFFENTEIRSLAKEPAPDLASVYQQAIARQFLADKAAMVARLKLHGIQALLTAPENLTLNTINKYLELKSRGLI